MSDKNELRVPLTDGGEFVARYIERTATTHGEIRLFIEDELVSPWRSPPDALSGPSPTTLFRLVGPAACGTPRRGDCTS